MSARSQMTMRTLVQRQTTGSDDQWGSEGIPQFADVGEVACRVWSSTKRHLREDGKSAVIEDLRAMMPLGADVQAGDRLESVKDRLGAELYAGPIAVENVVRSNRSGSRGSHLELMLVRNQ